MVSSVLCQNETPFRFSLSLRTEGFDLPSSSSTTSLSSPPTSSSSSSSSPAAKQEKVFEKLANEIPPNSAVELYKISRLKLSQQPYDIICELTPILSEGESPKNPKGESKVTPKDAKGETNSPEEAQSIQLRQRLSPKLLKNTLELSLGSYPHEALYPEQQWGNGHQPVDAIWTFPQGQLEIRYRAVRVPPHADVRVVYTIEVLDSALQEESAVSVSARAKEGFRQGLPANMVLEEVYENQRGGAFGGKDRFSSGGLFKTERAPWSNVHGHLSLEKDFIDVPNKSWRWVNEWRIDHSRDVDEDGWEYAMGWKREFSSECHRNSFVRRRRWIRLRQKFQGNPEDPGAGEEIQQEPTSERMDILEDIPNFQLLEESLKNPLLKDEKKVKMVTHYSNAHQLTAQELIQAMSHFMHEANRVDCFRTIYRKAENKDSILPVANTFKFFSNKRLLVAEFGVDLDRAGITA